MGTFVIVVSLMFLVVGMIGYCWLLVEAYGDDQLQGWLCLFFAPYGLYYLFRHVDPPKKWVILGLWLGGKIPGAILIEIAWQY